MLGCRTSPCLELRALGIDSAAMGIFKRIAPIFPVRDVKLSLEYYGHLGFATRAYERGGYGFATRDGIEIHLGVVGDDSKVGPSSAYLWVEDADELARMWSATGADVRFPEDTEWGQHEEAEFVAFRVGQDVPALGSGLADIVGPGAESEQPLQLGVLVAIGGVDVDVQSKLLGPRVAAGAKDEGGLRAVEAGVGRCGVLLVRWRERPSPPSTP
jgi:hypothetical protein